MTVSSAKLLRASCAFLALAVIAVPCPADAQDTEKAREAVSKDPLYIQVVEAMKKAATYYRSNVATHGGYVYYYSEDLKQRWGEGKADAVLAASLFHFGELTVGQVKEFLVTQGLPVRLTAAR